MYISEYEEVGIIVGDDFWVFCDILGAIYSKFALSFVKDEDNSVSLYFIPTQDSTDFLNYSVYYADDYNGPYTLLTSALTTCNTDCFDGLDPVVHNYYFIRSNFTGGVFYDSDTLAVINTAVAHGDGTAILTWNPDPYTPIPASSGSHYSVYRKS